MTLRLGGSQRLKDRASTNMVNNLPDMAAIYRPGVPVQSPDFGQDVTYTLLNTVEASYWTLTGSEALVLQRMDVKAEATVALPPYTDITELDQIVYTETRTGRIHHFNVTFVHERSEPMLLHVSVTEYKFKPD